VTSTCRRCLQAAAPPPSPGRKSAQILKVNAELGLLALRDGPLAFLDAVFRLIQNE
jgi:hypothetical protein